MSRRPAYSFAVVFAALVACVEVKDEDEGSEGTGGRVARSSGGTGSASVAGGGAGSGGAATGASAPNGAASGSGGATTSKGGEAGRPHAGGASGSKSGGSTSGGSESGGSTSGASAASGTSGGNGGEVTSAGRSVSAGAGGEAGEPGSGCADPMKTEDVSMLVASETMEPYFVSGNSAGQIRQSIDQNRGMDYDAFTEWYVSWQFDDCHGNGLVVTVELTYRYPEWTAPATASPELVESWDTYMDALFCHEYGHGKHGVDCANEVYTALDAIDAGGDCGEQQAQADAAFDAIIDKYNELDVQYDDDTNHGATMGAVFPP